MRDLLLFAAGAVIGVVILAVVVPKARRALGLPSRLERVLAAHMQVEADRRLLMSDVHDVFPEEK